MMHQENVPQFEKVTGHDRYFEPTIGDGDCLLNAITLAISEGETAKDIQWENLQASVVWPLDFAFRKSPIIKKYIEEKNLLFMANILVSLKKDKPTELQNIVAGVLRELVVKEARKDSSYQNATKELLIGAFNQKHVNNNTEIFDDIFLKYDFIKTKFLEFKNIFNLDNEPRPLSEEKQTQIRNAILKWWDHEDGFNTFLQRMGERGQWFGGQEAKLVAKLLGVHISYYKKDTQSKYGLIELTRTSDVPLGEFAFLGAHRQEILEQLTTRQVIESFDDTTVVLKDLSEAELKARMRGYIDDDEAIDVLIHVAKNQGRLTHSVYKPEPGYDAIIPELIRRNIIQRNDDEKGSYRFNVTAGEFAVRISPIAHEDKLIQLSQKYAKNLPTLFLHHAGNHWENTISPAALKEREDVVAQQKEAATKQTDIPVATKITVTPKSTEVPVKTSPQKKTTATPQKKITTPTKTTTPSKVLSPSAKTNKPVPFKLTSTPKPNIKPKQNAGVLTKGAEENKKPSVVEEVRPEVKEKPRASDHDYQKSYLEEFKGIKNNEFNENKWKTWMELFAADKLADLETLILGENPDIKKSARKVPFEMKLKDGSKVTKPVDERIQIGLDREIAKRLQQEEIALHSPKPKRRP